MSDINKRYIRTIKVLDQSAYLLKEFTDDHGYCTYCKQHECDSDVCAIAECINQCKKLSKEIENVWMVKKKNSFWDKLFGYLEYLLVD